MSDARVSIIIPAYNRGSLIGETLMSITVQTHTRWECLVIDDGSTDETYRIVDQFRSEDARFRLISRPDHLPAGANSCRNFGLVQSHGELINWCDSDDLLMPNCLAKKVMALTNKSLDFVVSRSRHFSEDRTSQFDGFDYGDTSYPLQLENFGTQKVGWLSLDVMYRRDSLEGIKWDETLNNGHEFNFNCKYLARNPRGQFLDEPLALVRRHPNSIMGQTVRGTVRYHKEKFDELYKTFQALPASSIVKPALLARALQQHLLLASKDRVVSNKDLARSVFRSGGVIELAIFLAMLASNRLFNKYYFLYTALKNRLYTPSTPSTLTAGITR